MSGSAVGVCGEVASGGWRGWIGGGGGSDGSVGRFGWMVLV